VNGPLLAGRSLGFGDLCCGGTLTMRRKASTKGIGSSRFTLPPTRCSVGFGTFISVPVSSQLSAEYIIYCDESDERGPHFSNFYGGVLIRSAHIDLIRTKLANAKAELNLFGEVKWQKVTENYAKKYKGLMDVFLGLVHAGMIKVRIMFIQNTIVAKGLTARHHEERYFILYYQFIKHAFGLVHSPANPGGTHIRIYPDRLPDTAEQIEKFKSHLASLTANQNFRRLGLIIRKEDVAEIDSHDHDILQCLDIVLGAMQFRLNDKHKQKSPGARRRGKRTIAKERVYNHINRAIRVIRPGFNIGITTGADGDTANRWHQPYRHWRFEPKLRIVQPGSKRRK
jgi:Protein of unknown function (DUF3800)